MMNASLIFLNPRNDHFSTTVEDHRSVIRAFDLTTAAEAVNRHLNRFIVILLNPYTALYEAFYRISKTGRVLTFLYLILVAFRSWFLLVKPLVDFEKKVNRSFNEAFGGNP